MKILGSEVYMAASHRLLQHEEVRQSVRLWTGAQSPDFGPDAARMPVIDRVTISDAARTAQAADPSAAVADADPAENDPRFVLLRAIIRLLTGEQARVFDARELRAPATAAPPVAARSAANGSAAHSLGRGVDYDLQSAHAEVEQLELAARGVVRTADGREISFALDISLSRTYYEESNLSLRLGDGARPRKDPLLVNFAGTSAQLVGQRFRFDLDVDGKAESINLPAAGTGFLVLDSNGDQRINDGSELFGALSGDGFADLEPLDDDGNGWIDENDAAYSQLRLWMPDADGGGPLLTLQRADIGALGLARVATPFDLRDGANETLAQLRSSGIYLRDSGGAGSLQQVDLSV